MNGGGEEELLLAEEASPGGGGVIQCRTLSSEGRGSTPAVVGPGEGKRRLGRLGRARGGGGPVWHAPVARPRKKGERAREKRKEVGPTRMNSADFDLNQIFKLI
jgi:hypothetical protein